MDDAGLPAIADLLAALCPAILLLRAGGRVAIGSSTLVRVGRRFLLATAAHNLDDARDEEIRLVGSGHTAAAALPFLRRSRPRRSDPADVAWVELAGETVANHGLGFVELVALGSDGAGASAPRWFLIEGYPAERVLLPGLGGGSLQAMGFVTVSAGHREGLSVLYPPPRGAATEGAAPHPYGISGGGIWGCGSGATGEWRTRTRLIGIARGWRRRRGTLHGTPIECWLSRVAVDLPDLRSLLATRLA